MIKKLFNFRPVLFIALSFCAGIALAFFWLCENIFACNLCGALFVCFNLLFVFPFSACDKRKISVIFSFICLLVFCLGSFSFGIKVSNFERADLGNHYYEISGKVAEVSQTSYGKKYLIKNARVKGNVSGKLRNNIALYVNGESDYDIGDIVEFSDYLIDKPLFYEGKFSSYDVAQKVKYTATVSADQVVFVENNPTIFQTIHVFIREQLKSGLGEDQFPTAYALLTGNSEQMDPDVLYSYRSAGVSHIFAVSGLHIGFIAISLGFLFNKLRLNRLLKAILITLFLIFYSGVCGFSASSLRATVMSSVLLFSSIGGNKYDNYSAISLSAIIVLAISPIQMLCAGFQLSFIIVLGMFLLRRPLFKLFRFLPARIAKPFSSVLSAQISGIPVSLAWFGEFSAIAIIANFLLIPVVGVVFIGLIVAVVFGAIFSAQTIFLFLPDLALRFINLAITAFDYRAFIVGGISMGGFVIFYYLTIVLSSGFINLKRTVRILTASITALTFIIGTISYTAYQSNRTRAYICGSETICATVISTPEENLMVVSNVNNFFYTSRLNRIAKSVGNNLDVVVILGGFNSDMQVFASRLRTVFNLNQIYYYGDRREDDEIVLMKSFPEITVNNFSDGKTFNSKSAEFCFLLSGNALNLSVSDRQVLIFSAFNKTTPYYADASGSYDLAVLYEPMENLSNIIDAEQSFAYRRNSFYKDAESGGNAIVLLA